MSDLVLGHRYLNARRVRVAAERRLRKLRTSDRYDLPVLVRVEESMVERAEAAEAAALAAMEVSPADRFVLCGGWAIERTGGSRG